MLVIILLFAYLSAFAFILGLLPLEWEDRPTLSTLGISPLAKPKKKSIVGLIRKAALVVRPLCAGPLRVRIAKDLVRGRVNISPEEFTLIKIVLVFLALFCAFPFLTDEILLPIVLFCFVGGYMAPEFFLKGRIKKIEAIMTKELPDAIDLLGLCVNAGLDFMLALRWVVDKSPKSVLIEELNTVMQEINVGKTRRDAIKDLAGRYNLPDLSTFSRTLVQADKMGTSVTEALNILSEDMRQSRYRRGEQIALKAPMKMLIPLLLFIFPVVGILVAGPIMIDFIENNPFKSLGGG